MIAWVTGLAGKAWLYVVAAGAGLAALGGLYLSIRKGGADAQRADDAVNVAQRTRIATQARVEAAKPVTPQEEDNDPNNRDR